VALKPANNKPQIRFSARKVMSVRNDVFLRLIEPSHVANCATLLAFTLFLPPLIGCPDLSQVSQVAKTTDGAKTSITAIAGDFKGSCDRQNLYVHLPPGPPPVPPPPKACVNGDDLQKLGNNLVVEQNVLLDYMDTLGNLAGTDASGFEKEAPSLNTSFKTAGMNSTQQDMAKQVGTLASDITKMATAGYREKRILEILQDADPAVTTLTTELADQVATATDVTQPPPPAAPLGTSYMQLLRNEDVILKSYYDIPLAKDHDSLTGMLVRAQYQSALEQLTAHESAAAAYRQLMLSIGQAHHKLLTDSQKSGFNKTAVEKIAKDFAQPVSEMSSAISTLQTDMR
jgi:hypothetical protein